MTKRIKAKRKKSGLSQTALGDLINVKKMQISRHETEQVWLRVDRLVQIASVLGCHPAELLPDPHAIEETEMEIIETFRGLEPAQQEILLQMIKSLAVPEEEEKGDAVAASA